jgi:hypothetical protein
MQLQMSTVRCCLPSAYPKPHWIMHKADQGEMLGRDAGNCRWCSL